MPWNAIIKGRNPPSGHRNYRTTQSNGGVQGSAPCATPGLKWPWCLMVERRGGAFMKAFSTASPLGPSDSFSPARVAQSLDGRINSARVETGAITGEASRKLWDHGLESLATRVVITATDLPRTIPDFGAPVGARPAHEVVVLAGAGPFPAGGQGFFSKDRNAQNPGPGAITGRDCRNRGGHVAAEGAPSVPMRWPHYLAF